MYAKRMQANNVRKQRMVHEVPQRMWVSRLKHMQQTHGKTADFLHGRQDGPGPVANVPVGRVACSDMGPEFA